MDRINSYMQTKFIKIFRIIEIVILAWILNKGESIFKQTIMNVYIINIKLKK